MLKRLGLGLLKGLLIGGAIGAGLQFGLGWTSAAGVLGFLLAMGAAGTAGVFAGKPPWRAGAWIESLLKGMVGVGVGALLYWLGSSYASFSIPFPQLGSVPWTSLPVVFAPLLAGIYGSLVELDNTPEKDDEGKGAAKKGPKARVELDEDQDVIEEESAPAKQKRKA
ncbi:MAG: hypothetical protein IT378_10980 [Sandaracinaceae bacterium]|nr:hypothetical protein [Sandaracinaceae bacterium]MCC6874819.1 hypothetical protein [Sandaracinaceae bacterium]